MSNITHEDRDFLNNFFDKLMKGTSTAGEVTLDKIGKNLAKMPADDLKYFGKLFKKYSYFGVMLAIKESLSTGDAIPVYKYGIALGLTFLVIPSSWGIIPTAALTLLIGEFLDVSWDYIEKNQDNLLEKLKELLSERQISIEDNGTFQCALPNYISICPFPKEETICKIKDLFNEGEETRSPLVVDLDGDGVETITAAGGVYFDHDGNGFVEDCGGLNAVFLFLSKSDNHAIKLTNN